MDLSWFRRKKKELTGEAGKREIPDGLWQKCPSCGEIIYRRELERNLSVCFKCGHHFRISSQQYIELLTDEGSFVEHFSEITSTDPLKFKDSKNYDDRIKAAKKKTGMGEAILCGEAKIDTLPMVLAVMDFSFMGGSMGSALGEKVARSIELALELKLGLVIVSASGGARMQEGILSLMQMAKTAAGLAKMDKAHLPYISVLTNPTTAGVMASYASLGDVVISEPGALIGFAGPRVIKQTTGQDMPEDRQKAESMLEHGMMDKIVSRTELRKTLAHLLSLTYKSLQIGPWAQPQDAKAALAGNRITEESPSAGSDTGLSTTPPSSPATEHVARRLQDLREGPSPSAPAGEPPGN
jgi:acetyl-CoA carboxylase carboxyl transferase subunit beta